MGDYVTDPKMVEQWKKRVGHDNPFIGRIFGEVVIWFHAAQSGISQNRSFLWTGSGLKPEERVSNPKTFDSPAAAVKEMKQVVVPHIVNYKSELAPFIKGWKTTASRVHATDQLPPGFEGFDTPVPPDTRSALKKKFESARKGQSFRLGSVQYEVRVNHGYVSGVPGMPRDSRGYMLLVFDAKLSSQERAAAKGGGTTTLVLDTATDKVYVYPWSTTRTDSRGIPKGKPGPAPGGVAGEAERGGQMNKTQEKEIIKTLVSAGQAMHTETEREIIATLVRAGRKDLAKQFAPASSASALKTAKTAIAEAIKHYGKNDKTYMLALSWALMELSKALYDIDRKVYARVEDAASELAVIGAQQ